MFLPEPTLTELSDADCRGLLASALPGWLDEWVRDLIIAEFGGNPLALLELPRAATSADLAGRIEDNHRRRLALLPATTGEPLLAAAEPTGDPALLWRCRIRTG